MNTRWLVVGLGNSGEKYHQTRHNIGFEIIDRFAKLHKLEFKKSKMGFVAEMLNNNQHYVCVKPFGYINMSGDAFMYYLNYTKTSISHTLTICDDLNLPLAKLKLKKFGRHAGHNGLKHIESLLGHNKFPRLKFGIGNDYPFGQRVEYVLGKWSEAEIEKIEPQIERACNLLYEWPSLGIDNTMSKYNIIENEITLLK